MSRGCVWNQALVELSPASEVLVGCSSGLEAAFEQVLVEPSGSKRHKLSGSAAVRGVVNSLQSILQLPSAHGKGRGATASVV